MIKLNFKTILLQDTTEKFEKPS